MAVFLGPQDLSSILSGLAPWWTAGCLEVAEGLQPIPSDGLRALWVRRCAGPDQPSPARRISVPVHPHGTHHHQAESFPSFMCLCFKTFSFKKVIEFLHRGRPEDICMWNPQCASNILKSVSFRERIKKSRASISCLPPFLPPSFLCK